MGVPRPHGINPTDQFLGLILDELEAQGEVLRRIADRLPEPVVAEQPVPAPGPVQVAEPAPAKRTDGGGKGGPVPVTEPAPPAQPTEGQPVAEPAPKRKQRDDPDDGTTVPPPPPRAGKGSGLEAWRSFANLANVPVPQGASRDDIIAACEKARVISTETARAISTE